MTPTRDDRPDRADISGVAGRNMRDRKRSAYPGVPNLSDNEAERIFEEDIKPTLGITGPARDPTYITVRGTPGAGKSTALKKLRERFGDDPTVYVAPDDHFVLVPGYARAATVDPARAWREAQPAVRKLVAHRIKYAYAQRANLVVESAFPPDGGNFLKHEDNNHPYARSRGYRDEMIFIMAHSEITSTAVLNRYAGSLKKRHNPRNCAVQDPDFNRELADQWPAAVFDVEKRKLTQTFQIRTRDGEVIHHNVLENGMWQKGETGLAALLYYRSKPLREDQLKWIEDIWKRLEVDQDLKSDPQTKGMPLSEFAENAMSFVERERKRVPILNGELYPASLINREKEFVGWDHEVLVANPPKNNRMDYLGKIDSIRLRQDAYLDSRQEPIAVNPRDLLIDPSLHEGKPGFRMSETWFATGTFQADTTVGTKRHAGLISPREADANLRNARPKLDHRGRGDFSR